MKNLDAVDLEKQYEDLKKKLKNTRNELESMGCIISPTGKGIPPEIYKRFRICLKNCQPFKSDDILRAFFVDTRISLWQESLPSTQAVADRVILVINFLFTQANTEQKANGLVLFLQVLAESYSPKDAQHRLLTQLANEIENVIKQAWSLHLKKKQEELQALEIKLAKLNNSPIGLPRKDFVDRVEEIWKITSFAPVPTPYFLLSAPSGYGKTELLKVINKKFQDEGWLCVSVGLGYKRKYSLEDIVAEIIGEKPKHKMPLALGGTIASFLRSHLKGNKQFSGVVLVIDNVETLKPETAKTLLDEIIPNACDGVNRGNSLARFILSGRYIADWQNLSNIPWKPISLPPFDFAVVRQVVGKVSRLQESGFTEEEKSELAAYLTYLTGGHPKCIAEILPKIESGFVISSYFLEEEKKLYTEVVKPVINELRSNIPSELRDIFDTMSIVRRFSSELLHNFIQKDFIQWPHGNAHMLSDTLTKTYLVKREGWLLRDGVVRRLLAIRMRNESPPSFIKICENSLKFYEEYLKSGGFRPDIIGIEAIFQKLQLLSIKKDFCIQDVLNYVSNLNRIIISNYNNDVLCGIAEILKDDWELQFNVNFFCGDVVYDSHPYAQLEKQITGMCNTR